MKKKYKLTGMTCSSCEAKVQSSLMNINNVSFVEVSKDNNSVVITSDIPISITEFQKVLDNKYQISEINNSIIEEQKKSWIQTYKPILLIFFYISLISILSQFRSENFSFMITMQNFMAGFFLVFSFFKLLNLDGFSKSYAMYDVIAKRFPIWGFLYAFLEFGLGIAFLVNFNPILINSITFLVMSISIIGVLQSVLNKKQIQCACLGSIFNLPMSTVTIVEDVLMIAMSLLMLKMYL